MVSREELPLRKSRVGSGLAVKSVLKAVATCTYLGGDRLYTNAMQRQASVS